ncbi:hypothetical protein FRC12_016564, partial [Ceratobasidium sp. 428]
AVLLLLRVWGTWGKNPRILLFLLAVFTCFELIPLVLLGRRIDEMRAIQNPLPGILTGCIIPFNLKFQWFRLFLCSLVYETILFTLTAIQAWQSYRYGMGTPLLAYIVRDGAGYFLVVVCAMLLTTIGTIFPSTLPAAVGSGAFLAVMSSMCCRLVLRLRSYTANTVEFSAVDNQNSTEFAMATFVSTAARDTVPEIRLNDGPHPIYIA